MVPGCSPLSANAATFAAVAAIRLHGPLLAGARSILKPVSFAELSVQTRSISVEDTAVAERELGFAGGVPDVGVCVGVLVGNGAVGVRVGVAVAAGEVGVRVGVAVGGTAVGVRVGVRVGVEVGGAAVGVSVWVGVGGDASVVADAVFE